MLVNRWLRALFILPVVLHNLCPLSILTHTRMLSNARKILSSIDSLSIGIQLLFSLYYNGIFCLSHLLTLSILTHTKMFSTARKVSSSGDPLSITAAQLSASISCPSLPCRLLFNAPHKRSIEKCWSSPGESFVCFASTSHTHVGHW